MHPIPSQRTRTTHMHAHTGAPRTVLTCLLVYASKITDTCLREYMAPSIILIRFTWTWWIWRRPIHLVVQCKSDSVIRSRPGSPLVSIPAVYTSVVCHSIYCCRCVHALLRARVCAFVRVFLSVIVCAAHVHARVCVCARGCGLVTSMCTHAHTWHTIWHTESTQKTRARARTHTYTDAA